MKKTCKSNPGLILIAIIFIAAMFTVSPLCASAALAAQGDSVATRLLGKPMDTVHKHFDKVRNRPSAQADLAKTFDERDYYKKGAVASLAGDEETSVFIDMRHDIDQVTETWHGSAGMQILW